MTVGILSIITAYLLGSIPFSFIFTRLIKGTDIRHLGTGNAGAMNTVREAGLLPGIAVLLLDAAKGSLSVLIAQWLGAAPVYVFLAGLAAVTGHNWPVFLKFRGGRGIATTLGVLLPMMPLELGISAAVMLTIFVFTRSSGLATGAGLLILPLALWASGRDISLILYSVALAIFLFLRNVLSLRRELARAGSLRRLIFQTGPPLWHTRKR